MVNICFINDLHLCHDGFNNIQKMNETIVDYFNSKIQSEDILYVLGDATMGKLNGGDK